MNRKQALETARAHVGHPVRVDGGWAFTAPWRPGDSSGLTTPLFAEERPGAVRLRAAAVVTHGLHLLGVPARDCRAAADAVLPGALSGRAPVRQNELWRAACAALDVVRAAQAASDDQPATPVPPSP